jgi:serine phosphatase RsbU (regulator of sigma subunit)
MKEPAQHPALLRAILGVLVMLLFVSTAVTIVKFAGSPTDENVFADTKTKMNLYVTKEVPAIPLRRGMEREGGEVSKAGTASILVGDLINLIDRKPVLTTDDFARALESIPPDSAASVYVYRATEGMFLQYRVERARLRECAPRFIDHFIEVTSVAPGGASDRAGMMVGDLIVKLNGKTFGDVKEADAILRRDQSGHTILYEVIRGNELLTLHVTLAQFGFPLAVLMMTLSGICMMGVGAFIMLKRPQLRAARIVGLGLFAFGYALAVLLIRRDVDSNLFVIARDISVGIAMLGGVVLMGRSTFHFPKERPDLLAKRWILIAEYSFIPLAVIVRLLIPMDNIATPLVLGLAVLFHLVVHLIYRGQGTAEHRRLSRVIRWTGIGIFCLSVGAVLASSVSKLGPFGSFGPIGIIGILLLAFPLAYLYTIGRYRLLGLNLRVKMNVRYSLVSIVWGVLLASGLFTLFTSMPGLDIHLPAVVVRGASIEVLDSAASGAGGEWTNRFVLMGAGVVIWYLLWRLRKAGQQWIDRKYYRTQYDYRRAANELNDVLSRKLSMTDLGTGLVETLSELMNVKRAGVFFIRGDSVSLCREAYGIDASEWGEFCGPVEESLTEVLAGGKEYVQAQDLPAPLREIFLRHQFQLLVPVRSKDRVLGVIVLGEKRSEATYSEDDYAFLSAAAQQASVSMENAFLYEELAEKERMKHELEIARRIQLASLPQHTPEKQGLDLAGASVPAMEVGGDFFDYLNGEPGVLTIVVGDVSGKGTSAALYMAKVQGILRSLHGFGLSPGDLFSRTNRLLCGDMEKKSFVTAVGAAFDLEKKSFILVRAGHLPLFHYQAAAGVVAEVTPRGLGLGLNNAGLFTSELEERLVRYLPGDVLLFVTDGITEAQNMSGELYGDERLKTLLRERAGSDAAGIRDAVLKDVAAFTGEARQHDDETIVVAKGR